LTEVFIRSKSWNELLLRKSWPYADDVDNIALHYTHVGKRASPQRIEFFAFTLPLFFLLRETLVTTLTNKVLQLEKGLKAQDTRNSLLGSDGFKLDSIIGIDSPTGRATFVEVFFDVVPTKATNLISTDTRLEVEI